MKRFLIAGLLVWLPLTITVYVLLSLVGLMDGVFGWLLSAVAAVAPLSAQSGIERLRDWPGLGVLVMLLVLLATGVFATNFFGQWWLRQWDRLVGKIPIVKSIYNSVKQVSDTLFSTSGNAFREAVLVQYPRAGAWTIAFVTGRPGGEVAEHLQGDWLSIYVPTTPNPTSGFLLYVPKRDVIFLAMSVEDAAKLVISAGLVYPQDRENGKPTPAKPGAAREPVPESAE